MTKIDKLWNELTQDSDYSDVGTIVQFRDYTLDKERSETLYSALKNNPKYSNYTEDGFEKFYIELKKKDISEPSISGLDPTALGLPGGKIYSASGLISSKKYQNGGFIEDDFGYVTPQYLQANIYQKDISSIDLSVGNEYGLKPGTYTKKTDPSSNFTYIYDQDSNQVWSNESFEKENKNIVSNHSVMDYGYNEAVQDQTLITNPYKKR